MEEIIIYALLTILTIFFIAVGIMLRVLRKKSQENHKHDIVSLFGVKALVEKEEQE